MKGIIHRDLKPSNVLLDLLFQPFPSAQPPAPGWRGFNLAEETDTLITSAAALLKRFPQREVSYDPKDFGWKLPR